jgi:signal transduction histidine kinase
MLDGCIEMMRGRMDRAGITAERQFPHEPVRAVSYEGPLRRAVANILNNAIQAMPDGGVLRVALGRSGSGPHIEISDTGPGIPHRLREQVFEMFFTTRPEGTGLGLSLAKAAIENCGGTIKIIDAPAGGSCFRIELPVRPPVNNHGANRP